MDTRELETYILNLLDENTHNLGLFSEDEDGYSYFLAEGYTLAHMLFMVSQMVEHTDAERAKISDKCKLYLVLYLHYNDDSFIEAYNAVAGMELTASAFK